MKRVALLFASVAMVATAAYSGEGKVRRSMRPIPGRYIVALDPAVDTASVVTAARKFKGAQVRHTYERGIKGFALEVGESDAQLLAADPRVRFVEEDATVSAAVTTWGLDRIDQRTLPLNGTYVSAGAGAGVTIYIVDTGIFAAHADFGGRVAAGFDAVGDGVGSSDCNGHGTHVAGLAGGAHFGVATSSTLVPVRVLDCNGSGSLSNLLAGIDWILADRAAASGPAVVNMSLNGHASSALDAAVNEMIGNGLTTVVAAGNSNEDACGSSPARVGAAITVGASTETDQRAPFSNYGVCVDLFAPGTNIISDWYSSSTAVSVADGTSASAPFVAGVAALWLEKYPDASAAAIADSVLSDATAGVLGGLDSGSPNRLLYSMIGSLDGSPQSDEQLLADPSFEYGTTFWSSDVCSVVNPAGCGGYRDVMDAWGDFTQMSFARTGTGHAAIGGPARDFNVQSEAVTIPSTATKAELSVYLWVITKNKKPVAADTLMIEVRGADGALLETLGTFSNLDAAPMYGLRRFDVTKHRGTAIRISFTGVQSQGPPTWFLLDDAQLNIWK